MTEIMEQAGPPEEQTDGRLFDVGEPTANPSVGESVNDLDQLRQQLTEKYQLPADIAAPTLVHLQLLDQGTGPGQSDFRDKLITLVHKLGGRMPDDSQPT